ncbi:hypothetical protein QP166_13275 [Sphingomonas sp. LR60]|uniref:hypothetical protein n=1 Tax=Sphingomonas sp. LR60 TaxID=3050233 RepID=UPI002FE28E8C
MIVNLHIDRLVVEAHDARAPDDAAVRAAVAAALARQLTDDALPGAGTPGVATPADAALGGRIGAAIVAELGR